MRPNGAADPGLVYDSDVLDWLAFLCGSTAGVNPATCTALASAGYSFDASDLNVPSIAIGDLAGIQTVTRRVTNVGGSPATYNASVTGMSGFTTVVTHDSRDKRFSATRGWAAVMEYTLADESLGGDRNWQRGELAVATTIPLGSNLIWTTLAGGTEAAAAKSDSG